jgi:C-terminal processing protease CtpA/Prc
MSKDFTQRITSFTLTTLFVGLLVGICSQADAQSLGPYDRDSARAMLSMVKDDLKAHYYDPTFRGVDLDARFKEAEGRVKSATTRDQLMAIVAQSLLQLNDSHTFLIPPSRAARIRYGWQMQMIGDTGYVSAVEPKSDADGKGLKPGDKILALDGVKPTREIFWKMLYRYYALMPARNVRMLVQSPGSAEPRQLDVLSKVQEGAAVTNWGDLFIKYLSEEWDLDHDRFYEVNSDLLVWKMPTFAVSKDHVDAIMSRARKFKTLVIDLRGNGGGYVETLTQLTSHFFDRELKIADLKSRKETKPELAKKRGGSPFTGRLIILVDSNSASASEMFARVMQLEKRGTILGDNTAGAVMTSRSYDHQSGVGSVLYFGASVTVADVIMADGRSLENVGVQPDEVVLPTGADFAAKRDPVLARAAQMAGVELTAEKAGALFPVEWKRQ